MYQHVANVFVNYFYSFTFLYPSAKVTFISRSKLQHSNSKSVGQNSSRTQTNEYN